MKKSEEIVIRCQKSFEELIKCLNEKKEKNTTKKLWQNIQEVIFFKQFKINLKMARNIPNIEDSFEKIRNLPNVTERYYKQFYFLHTKGDQSEHHCVLVHSNKICLVTLAPSHPIIKGKKKILKLDFQVSNKLDRLENKVRGKNKKGGQCIMPCSVLCYVECEDGAKYSIHGCIKGKLVEINQLLLKDPNILVDKPLSEGFLAIIWPSLKDFENFKNKLLTQEKYENEVLSVNM